MNINYDQDQQILSALIERPDTDLTAWQDNRESLPAAPFL